ncbi:MAG: hypothetical protein OEM82_12185 [Acidobacteriota bacterium]|nr:hypothetical protein [Acidobacteriota bacterium]MDH3529579.1 hypothetical protein [Acidobacteriota bacterium]
MAWIKTIRPQDAGPELLDMLRKLRSTFPTEYSTPVPAASSTGESIVESHSLIPDALFHGFMTASAAMTEDLPLERRHHEMIATVVSGVNDCHY